MVEQKRLNSRITKTVKMTVSGYKCVIIEGCIVVISLYPTSLKFELTKNQKFSNNKQQ